MKFSLNFAIVVAIIALIAGSALAADDSIFKADRASKLIGAKAIDEKGQTLGTVNDLVIGEDNMINYVVVEKADKTGFVAVPFTSSGPQVNPDGDVVLAIAKPDFDNAPSFASNNFPEMKPPSQGMAHAYRTNPPGMDVKIVNGIATVNPYSF